MKPEEYERTRDELAEKLEAMNDPMGKPLGTRAIKPQEVYSECRGIPPDLIVYFGDLHWGAEETMGNEDIYVPEVNTVLDDANHSEHGVFILYDPAERVRERLLEGLHVVDVAPTLLNCMGLPVPGDMEGTVVCV